MSTTVQLPATDARSKDRPIAGWRQVSLAMFAVAWGGNQFTPLLSMYRAESSFSEVTVNVLLFAYVVGLVPSLLASPAMAARFGGKKPLAAAISLSALGSLLLMAGASAPAVMFLARTLSGVALGLGMVVGGLALKALAVEAAEHAAPGARQPSAARTSAMGLTAGFGLGAGLAGIVAQWLPLPTLLPYVLHLAVCAAAGAGMVRFRTARHLHDGGEDASRRPFPREYLLAVLPAAPLIFGALGIAYAVLPSVVATQVGGFSTAFSALLCLLCLGLGFAAQRVVAHLSARRRVPARTLGVVLFVAGGSLAVAAANGQSVGLVVLAAAVFGIGYGLTLIGCLQDCDRLALPGQLGPMTSLVYSLAYIGFGLPTAIAWLHESFRFRHTAMLAWIAAIAAAANLAGALAAKVRRA